MRCVNSINWPEILVGFALGLVPLVMRQTYIYFKYLRSPGKEKFTGQWYNYYRSSTGSGQIRREQLVIKYSFLRNRLVVEGAEGGPRSSGQQAGVLRYSGYLTSRQGMVRYLYIKDIASHVQEMWCLIDPFYAPFDHTIGVLISLDLRGLPVALPCLLSRVELDSAVVERLLPKEVLLTDPLKELASHGSDTDMVASPATGD
jgi:hypothetical protein